MKLRDILRQIALAHSRKVVDLVIAWELMHPALTGTIIGIRDEKEAREMIGGVGWRLTDEQMKTIENALTV